MSVTGWDDTESYTLRGSGPQGAEESTVPTGGSSLLTRVILMIVGCTLLVGMIAMGVSSVLVGRQQREALTHRAALVGTLQASAMGQAVWEYDTRGVEAMIRGLMAEDPAVRSVKVWGGLRRTRRAWRTAGDGGAPGRAGGAGDGRTADRHFRQHRANGRWSACCG